MTLIERNSGIKKSVPKRGLEVEQMINNYNEPCTVRQMTPEEIAKYGAPLESKPQTRKRVKTTAKQEAKK